MYLYFGKLLPLQFFRLFTNRLTINDKFTTSQAPNNINVPKFSAQRSQKRLSFQGAKIWNSFSHELRSQSYVKFKAVLNIQFLAEYHKKIP